LTCFSTVGGNSRRAGIRIAATEPVNSILLFSIGGKGDQRESFARWFCLQGACGIVETGTVDTP
jgi:hypothetical protein